MKKKLLQFKQSTIILFAITTIILLVYSLGYKNAIPYIKYFSYLYSTFSLIVVILNTKRFHLYIKNKILNTNVYKGIKTNLYRNKYIEKYFEDLKFKNLINLCLSSIINFSFIFIKFVDGINSKSIWFVSLSVYYFILTLIKLFLLSNLKDYEQKKEYIVYRNIGYFLMPLNIALVVMIIQMVRTNVAVIPEGYIIYATAFYSFYLIISAIINLIKYRKYKSPILSSIKVINLLTASVSILMLQTTMIATFGENYQGYMRLMNSVTGGIISLITLGISTYMILKGQKQIKKASEY